MATKLKAYKLSEAPSFDVEDVVRKEVLNYTEVCDNHNKFYSLEIQINKIKQYRVYTEYGRVGAPNPAKEVRLCTDEYEANQVVDKILKDKQKKGYVKVQLIKSDVGSDVARSKIEANSVTAEVINKLGINIKEESQSSLHPAIRSAVSTWFGSIEQFIVDTLDTSRCALGQLSLEQINKGRDLLLEARTLVTAGAKDITELNGITSKYYSNIPMNFGFRKLNPDVLRFDSHDKLDTAFDALDVLESAKNIEKVLTRKNSVDDKYKTLKTEMEWMDPSDPMYKWIDLMFHKTRAHNHDFLGKIRINNIFKLFRNEERENFLSFADKLTPVKRKELPGSFEPIWKHRAVDDSEYEELKNKANILPLFHGTRTTNFAKILPSKLKMRKPGFTVAGSMFDAQGGIYFADRASKSCQYTSASGSCWAGGTDKKGYMFLTDVALGQQHQTTRPYQFTLKSIQPCMSVWAKSGPGTSLVNDEFIVYTEDQSWLRYVIEFETGVR